MSATVLLSVILVVLFFLNYFMKRRFGLLGLALGAGALISSYWAGSLTPILVGQGLSLTQPQVEVGLTLLPALLFLFVGPTYGKMHMQIIGSALFTVLAMALLLRPLGALMEFDDMSVMAYNFADEYQGAIVVIGLLAALVDVFIGRSSQGSRGKKAVH